MTISNNHLILFSLAILFASCNKESLSALNEDPNRPSEVPTPTLFLSAQKQVMDNLRNENLSLRGTNLFAQYYSQYIYTDQSRYDIPRSYGETYWNNAYKAINNLEEIVQLNTNEKTRERASAGNAGTNTNQIAVVRILKAYAFHNLTDVFGDIPYQSYGTKNDQFQALQRNPEILTPVYAPQESIYKDLLKELKEAGDTLWKYRTAYTFGIPGNSYDNIYKSSNEKWARFANSLRLRLATRIKSKLPALAEEHVADALAKGVFNSNQDNAVFTYQTTAPNEAPLYRATVTQNRRDFAVSKVMVDVLKGESGTVRAVDPRLAVYARPNDAGAYRGLPYGLDPSASGILKIEEISLPGVAVNAADFGEVLQEYAEVEFLLSEYRNWSEENYRMGVRASLEKWGIDQAAIGSYMAALPAANKENVLNQKYIALFAQGSEAWSEIRRTGYPKFLIKPGDITWTRETAGGSVSYRFQPLFGNAIPSRLYYPDKEQAVNLGNYQKAVAAQGEDNLQTKVWWNK